MLIQNWMSRPVVTIGPNVSMQGAQELMAENGIRALPVIQSEKLIGILTDNHTPKGIRQIYLRLHGLDRRKLVKLSMSLGDIGILLYMVDHKNNRRDFFAAA